MRKNSKADTVPELLLGVDVGTYSTKGVLVTAGGEVLASHVIEHTISIPRPGWAEQDADLIWWGEVRDTIRALLTGTYSGEDVVAVGISAIGSCMLPIDRDGNALRPGILYGIDTRATAEIEALNARFGEAALFELGGMALTSQAIGPKIMWFRQNEPDLFARTETILTASSYPVLKLTGERVMDRHSASYFNPLFDIRKLEWDSTFSDPITPVDRLPRLLWSDEVAGTVTQWAAEQTGLVAGTPVSAGTIDAAAEALSVGATQPGDLMVMYGSTMFFIQVTDHPTPDPRMWCCAYCFDDRYGIEGGMATSGALTRWFRDQFARDLIALENDGGTNAYALLAQEAAASPPGARGVVCLPYFSGERTPINDPEARGLFAGMSLAHTRGDLYRSVLEGTAYGVRHNIEVMNDMGAAPKRIIAVGGGTRNPLWLQIVSDVTGLPQLVPRQTIGASYGDAFLAGLAAGVISDRDEINRTWVDFAAELQPDPAAAAAYEETYEVYRSLYPAISNQLHNLARLETS